MARFIDLDDVYGDGSGPLTREALKRELLARAVHGYDSIKRARDAVADSSIQSTPVVANVITDAFGCYPIAAAVASFIDLNTLDALARTSRGIHDGLVQYRTALLTLTLRCSNQALPVNREDLLRYRARAANWHAVDDGSGYNGKVGDCARDMVDGCRRCGKVVCRNCAIKPPAPVDLRDRHRRLCMACARAPIATLIRPPLDQDTPFCAEAVQRARCKCATKGVWLCQPCGRSIRCADHEYRRVWHWRSQYGEILGGLGTGIGDGDRGVTCGREGDCLAARDREQEVDCDAEDARDNETAPWTAEQPSPASGTSTEPITTLIDEFQHENERTPSPQLGPGYERHEMVGIGGKVKRKLVRMVRIGACVPEGDDEKGPSGRVLGPEIRGVARSWCGWCWRVIPGSKDMGEE